MKIVLIIISILLIAIVLLQAGKAEGASSAMMGGNDSLFKNRKERTKNHKLQGLLTALVEQLVILCLEISILR